MGDWGGGTEAEGCLSMGSPYVGWTREPFQIYKKCFKHGRIVFLIKDGKGNMLRAFGSVTM